MLEQTLFDLFIKVGLILTLYMFVCTFFFVSADSIVAEISAHFGMSFVAVILTTVISIFTQCIFMLLLTFISEFAKSSLVMLAKASKT
jgi:hypothetical protein